MRAFISGANGYIGSAIVRAFRAAGHEVTALVRAREKGRAVEALGARLYVGDLSEPRRFASDAADHDVVVHAAFDYSARGAADAAVVDALLASLAKAGKSVGTPRAFLYTSGIWVLDVFRGAPLDESAGTDAPAAASAWRPAHEQRVLAAARDSLATSVIRPGMVYGGKGGSVTDLFDDAVYVGDGKNRWPLVHHDDCAALYLLVAEKRARGVFHAVDAHPTSYAEVARIASEVSGHGGKTRSIPLDEARARMGVIADALVLDQIIVAKRARELGWSPKRASFEAAASEAFAEARA